MRTVGSMTPRFNGILLWQNAPYDTTIDKTRRVLRVENNTLLPWFVALSDKTIPRGTVLPVFDSRRKHQKTRSFGPTLGEVPENDMVVMSAEKIVYPQISLLKTLYRH